MDARRDARRVIGSHEPMHTEARFVVDDVITAGGSTQDVLSRLNDGANAHMDRANRCAALVDRLPRVTCDGVTGPDLRDGRGLTLYMHHMAASRLAEEYALAYDVIVRRCVRSGDWS